ncbi:hypothetical protein OsJ_23265 [Oryza sativa Japonica Group]|uniref:Uncharacterized protein n=1 Tax=Oryza sativa subsp. japonica TaxID=39947 RepID=Q6ZA52_ORYSJ|nr:hypothetical protein OsJ_23265 [Oryza sativa Japonica Group]BAC83618.1 hypothetical protein [Oryza sativa Japonica Group]
METAAAEWDHLLCSLLEEGRSGVEREPPPTTITAAEVVAAVAQPKHGRVDTENRWKPTHALACMRVAVWFFNTVSLVLFGIVVVKVVPHCKTMEEVFACILAILTVLGILIMGYCMIKNTKEDIKAMEGSP